MRYEHDGSFVEFSESWTRGEMRKFWELRGDDYWQLVLSKITNCQLACPDGVYLTKEQLTIERLDEIDYVIWRWFSATPVKAVSDVATLGESVAASLLTITATAAKAADDQPTQ